MGLQTKIVVSFLSILGCISVMTTGIVAILLNNTQPVVTQTTLGQAEIKGSRLYGARYGANEADLSLTKLYEDGVAVDEEYLNQVYLKPVKRFGTNNHIIEYIFKYELDPDAIAVNISLLNVVFDADSIFECGFQYIMGGEKEPTLTKWNTESTEFDGTIMVGGNSQRTIIWIRSFLTETADLTKLTNHNLTFKCKWYFTFDFSGYGETQIQ